MIGSDPFPFREKDSDDSVDIEDYKQIRKKSDGNAHKLNAGIDTFSQQFEEEKNSLRFKKEHYMTKGGQFSQEKQSDYFVKKWILENEERLKGINILGGNV